MGCCHEDKQIGTLLSVMSTNFEFAFMLYGKQWNGKGLRVSKIQRIKRMVVIHNTWKF